jgi:serine/threonine-protein kinase
MLLDGRYLLEGLIGTGGECYVHRAKDVQTGRPVAIRQYQKNGPEARKRWERECTVHVRSEHLVEHLGGGEADGSLYVVTELFEGRPLDEIVEETGTFLPDDEPADVTRQIAMGLADLHEAGWAHRDLKSANVLVGLPLMAKIIDLGLIKGMVGPTLVDDGMARGTLHFMSPEHLTTPDLVGCQSDLYALGVIFYQLSTGTLPFDGANAADVQTKILCEEPVSPRLIRPELSARDEEIILRLLEKDRRARFPSARSLLLALDGQGLYARCPACRMPTGNGMRYCPTCGVELGSVASAPALLRVETRSGCRWIAIRPEGLELGRALLDPANRAVSTRHARIFSDGGHWHLEDLGSTNGTRADGRLVRGRALLSNGSLLQFADVTCTFCIGQP